MVLLEVEDRLKKTMTREITLFSSYKEEFSRMKEYVQEKQWPALERTLVNMDKLSTEIAMADEERFQLYGKIKTLTNSKDDESFYSVITKVHKEGSGEIYDIYRMVKHEAKSLKVMGAGFNRYLQNRKDIVGEFVGEIVPESKGTIYNRRGYSSSSQPSSLVINRHF